MSLTEIIVVIGIIILVLGFIVPAAAGLWRAVMNLAHNNGLKFGHH
jgi:hypothetical protein